MKKALIMLNQEASQFHDLFQTFAISTTYMVISRLYTSFISSRLRTHPKMTQGYFQT
jgi:hypothetical protein